jgi:thioredoxin 1
VPLNHYAMPVSDPSSAKTQTPDTMSWVVCLCADWCRACNDYQRVFSQIADEMADKYPHSRFVWIDVEDQDDLVGDLDIETFPTILVGNDKGVNFLGAVTPQPEVLSRLLQSILEPGARQTLHVPATQQVIGRLADLPGLWLQTELLNR